MESKNDSMHKQKAVKDVLSGMNRFSIKDIELLTGIKSHTLRIWEQRYGLPAPKRTASNIRFYDDEDLRQLLNISILNRNGIRISKISKLTSKEKEDLVMQYCIRNNDQSGNIESLINAMINLDEFAFEKTLSTGILRYGIERTMIEVVFPFLRRIGVLWQLGNISPAYEHFLSNLIRRKLIVAIDALPVVNRPGAKKFLMFLPQDEYHELGLLFAKFIIKKAGHKTVYLGQNLPVNHVIKMAGAQDFDFIMTAITACIKLGTIQQFVTELARKFPKSKVICSGCQVSHKNFSRPSNVIVISEFEELIDLVNKIEPA